MNINIINALQQQWQLIAIYFLLFLLLIAIMAHDVFHLNDSTIEMWTGICFCFHFQSRIKQIICFTCLNKSHMFRTNSMFSSDLVYLFIVHVNYTLIHVKIIRFPFQFDFFARTFAGSFTFFRFYWLYVAHHLYAHWIIRD